MKESNDLTWEAELEQLKCQLSSSEKTKCTQCKESIVSWNGEYLLCSKKGIILKPLIRPEQ